MHTTSNAVKQNIFLNKSLGQQLLIILSAALVLALASQISIPLTPVPLTFQSATVILIGMTLGARNATAAILTYLIAGFSGIPIFADFSGGAHYLASPTTGYLIGFLPAAFVAGYLAQKGFARNFFSSFLIACLAASIIFACGLTVLAKLIGWNAAVTFGLMPFIYSEIIKLALVALFVPYIWRKKS